MKICPVADDLFQADR